jgi:hypothetical protein
MRATFLLLAFALTACSTTPLDDELAGEDGSASTGGVAGGGGNGGQGGGGAGGEGGLSSSCCKVCRAGKACGDSCISRESTCYVKVGCACDAGPE